MDDAWTALDWVGLRHKWLTAKGLFYLQGKASKLCQVSA